MSRKSKRNQPKPAAAPAQPARRPGWGRRALFAGTAVALLIAFVLGAFFYSTQKSQAAIQAAAANRVLLEKDYSPVIGKAQARVHIVEFLDPACGTCAAFYPMVKRLMAEHPDRIRLSVRHVPFHEGADDVVRMLEAARLQGKYWAALEALLASRDDWTASHVAHADRALPTLARVGVDLDRLRSDMQSPEISRRIRQDLADARSLGVSKTPEFFVNGRPLPRFGFPELKELVRDEVQRAYP